MAAPKLKISVYDFDDYKAFLQAAYDDLTAQNPAISYRWIQKRAGYSTRSNHFWQKLTGHSPMSVEAAERYGRALGLTERELRFLVCLVKLGRAKQDSERERIIDELNAFPRFTRRKTGGRLRWEYYQSWYLPALRALVTLDDFREEPEWMARKLNPPITPGQAKSGLTKLVELGFLQRDGEGRLVQSEPFVGDYADRKEPSQAASVAVRKYHRKMIRMAADSIEAQAQAKRYIVGNTMGVSHNQVKRLRAACEAFMHQIEGIIAEDEPIETVYRLNLQLFGLTDDKTKPNT